MTNPQPNDAYWHADEFEEPPEQEPLYSKPCFPSGWRNETDDQWLDRVTGSNLLGRLVNWLAKLGG